MTVPGSYQEQFTVTAGRLDDAAREAFANGQCHSFARAMTTATGWPMAVLVKLECCIDPDLAATALLSKTCAPANWLTWPWFGRTALSSTSTAHMLPRPCPARKSS